MTSEKTIEERLEKLAQAISPDETLIENVMSRINATPIAGPSIGPVQNIWRTIMKNPITKLAAAAVIIIACFTGLHFWKSTGSGIALADVLTRIEQVTGYMYQMSSTMTRQGTTTNSTSTVLVSQDHGVRTIRQGIDPNNGEIQDVSTSYILPGQNSLIRINHGEKTYMRMKFEDATTENHEEDNDPRTMIKQFLSCDHTSLGQSVIDGVTVEGFQTTDPAYKGSFYEQTALFGGPRLEKVNVKIWVDVNTFLPVRSEEDIVTKGGKSIYQVSYDFRWNVVVNPDDFEPNIPEDYRSRAGDIIIPVLDEENAIKGLRLLADAIGKYPASCMTILDEYRRHTEFDPNSYMNLSDEERTRKTSELISLVAPRFFYKTLVKDNKDPVYNGETVKPGDADKVLLRWKLEDGQYRVIFGDLHVDTVTADVMIELETAPPK